MSKETKKLVEILKEDVAARLELNQKTRREIISRGELRAISSEECKTLAETLEILKRLEMEGKNDR